MADTFAEIYNDTLVESDFDSNGEATIVTTNASTSHVIKGVNAVEGDSNVPVEGSLNINGFNVVGLTGDSSGSEIVAPSSTIKVTTDKFPLSYSDDDFIMQRTDTVYTATTDASVNGYVALPAVITTANSMPSITADSGGRDLAPNVGPNSNTYIYATNGDNATNAWVFNSSGTQIYSQTETHRPKWWDGERYAYYYDNSPAGINRIDTWNGTSELFKSHVSTTPNTYGRMFGVKDKYLFFWPIYNVNLGYVYDFSTDRISPFTAGTPSSSINASSANYYAVQASNGTVYFLYVATTSIVRYASWTPGQVFSSDPFTGFSIGGDRRIVDNVGLLFTTKGSRFYYIDYTRNLAYLDFEGGSPAYTQVTDTAPYTVDVYGRDLTYVNRTPDTSTVSGRTYGVNPSLKLRITGVTST